jgi:hypothetical protein
MFEAGPWQKGLRVGLVAEQLPHRALSSNPNNTKKKKKKRKERN